MKETQSLHPLPQVIPTTESHRLYNMSSITADVFAHEFSTSTTTLVDPPAETSPPTPPPEVTTPVERPANRPPLTITTDDNVEPGEITHQVIQESYPLSPQSSINILQARTNLDPHTLHTIAIGLANMAIGRTFQHLEAKSKIAQLRKELTDLRAQMSREPNVECPQGFEENHGCLPDFTIPDADGIMRQAWYIKLGDGPVPCALGTLGHNSNPIFPYDLFAAPSYIQSSPTEPLLMWLINTISGKSSSYHQAMELARSTDDRGLAAKIAHYHESDTRVLNIAAEIHALDCELQVVKATSRQSRSRLEGARAQHRLRALQALDTRHPTHANVHAAGLHFSRGRPSFLDGE